MAYKVYCLPGSLECRGGRGPALPADGLFAIPFKPSMGRDPAPCLKFKRIVVCWSYNVVYLLFEWLFRFIYCVSVVFVI